MAEQFPIVGIGASAGGLKALEVLLRTLPANSGSAFVVVTHLARGQESKLTEILGRFTEMPVIEASHNHVLEVDHVYVLQSSHVITLQGERLHLELRLTDEQLKPIDIFFGSLSQARGEYAVGIVLSGSGSDGTLGCKAIKARGGLTLAQGSDGAAPQYTDMPRAAVMAGCVDMELPVQDMAAHLVKFAQRAAAEDPLLAAADDAIAVAAQVSSSQFNLIYSLLRERVGHDFSGYKRKTFLRRMRRRMEVCQCLQVSDYIEKLMADGDELTLLFRDLLIGVTNFFRDAEAFNTLAHTVVPDLFNNMGPHDTVRVWVPACSTGEEAFSIAIVLREYMSTLATPPKVQIFATDIDDSALSVARAARYPAALLTHVEQKRIDRFFIGDGLSYSVAKEVRDMCLFSSHSILRDPPFSKIDLISCRNLLIYLGTEFQEKVIPVFHFALRSRGYLFLGTSENISRHIDLFTGVDKKQRIFRRRDNVHVPLPFPFFKKNLRALSPENITLQGRIDGATNMRKTVEARVLDKFSPAHVVINADGDVLHYSSRTGKYLEAAPGLPNRQILAMARRGMRMELSDAMRQAAETRRAVTKEGLRIELEDRVQCISVTVEPFGDNVNDPLFLIVFCDVGQPLEAAIADDSHDGPHGHHEKELHDLRERLQATVEEYEVAVEDLKSSNEELQSINEELQSTNEELETSKEELQSVNEELQTVNAELNIKVEELDRSNNDLRNVFESTQVGTVFLDRNLLIRNFTPAISSIFKLIASDRGRPLTDLVSHIDNPILSQQINAVLNSGEALEQHVRSLDSACHYFMRILPYRHANASIDGVLLTFFDITKVTAAEQQLRVLIEELNHRVRNMLTVVQAIAQQTLRHSSSTKNFAESFMGRLRAMSTAYSLVSAETWGDVGLSDIISNHLKPYEAGDLQRISIQGPEVLCTPVTALALGMVIHELATNAVKYGALDSNTGRLSITWSVLRDPTPTLELLWSEQGGPPVVAPQGKGFGTELVERELTQALKAKSDFQYRPEGLLIHIHIPFSGGRIVEPVI